jgi:transcriptional regulator ATRX
MEEKIYQRQVAKQSLSQRVVDEHQLDRHFTSEELKELYKFEPDIWKGTVDHFPEMPTDDILKRLLSDFKQWIYSYHSHDSLLQNKLSEGLSEEDRKAAWDEYEAEKNHRARIINSYEEYQFNMNMNNEDFINSVSYKLK